MNALNEYERRVAPARTRLAEGRWVREILSPGVAPDRLERFLIYFCALGARMTEPVEGWIRRAGERCRAVGFDGLGRALIRHAQAEAGHHQMMINDAFTLANRRVRGGRTAIDVAALLGLEPSPAIRRYVALHEDTIAGETPCAQIAIELEIESMSTVHGPTFVERCVATLGGDVSAGLTFVLDHVELDVGHTRFNRGQLGRLLKERADVLDALVAAGSEALDAYAAFFDDCIARAEA